MDNVRCDEDDEKITDCSFDLSKRYHRHEYDTWLLCQGMKTSEIFRSPNQTLYS